MRLRHLLCVLTAVVVSAMLAGPSAAHWTVHRAGSTWYFDGNTYGNSNGTGITDPIDLAFFRSSSLTATSTSIHDAFINHWRGPGTMGNGQCKSFSSPQYAKWRAFKRYNGADRTSVTVRDFQELNGSVASIHACGDEYHVRWWTDDAHAGIAQGADPHGSTGQWVVGDPHHEDRSIFGSHHIDRDWDQVRNTFISYMSYYCGRRHFHYDAASYGYFQGYFHDGYLGSLSLRPASSGC